MKDRSKTYPAMARALFASQPGLELTTTQVSDRLGVVGHVERGNVRRSLRDLVEAGWLRRIGQGVSGTYVRTGADMTRLPMAPEQRRQRNREISKAYKDRVRSQRHANLQPLTINRARVELKADLTPAKPWGQEKQGQRPAETVDEFKARGGQVQRLPASWEQAA